MANPHHLEIARQGRDAWNKWRKEHPGETADFSDVDFTLDENKDISFAGFEFGDDASFKGVDFDLLGKREIHYARYHFGDLARFEGATFGVSANFEGAKLGNVANFEGATFGGWAKFEGAKFRMLAGFVGATFGSGAVFKGATFGNGARFKGATFGDSAWFDGATFGDSAGFAGATFKGSVSFAGNQQGDQPANRSDPPQPSSWFVNAKDPESSNRPEASNNFLSINFSHARFLGSASFADRDFLGEVNFSAAYFNEPPTFRAIRNRENLDWTGVRFAFGWYPNLGPIRIAIRGWTTKIDTVTRLRRLRGIAREIHAVDAERDLFILERQAERGVLWLLWWRGGWRSRLTGWWRPLISTILMFLYRWSSNCGRSVWLPLFWLVVSNVGLFYLYKLLIQRPRIDPDLIEGALFDLTFASAIPFGATARPAFQSAVKTLFESSAGLADIAWQIQAASATQGITNLVLLFLLGLALRNHFKVK